MVASGKSDQGCEVRGLYFNVYHFLLSHFSSSGAFKIHNLEQSQIIIYRQFSGTHGTKKCIESHSRGQAAIFTVSVETLTLRKNQEATRGPSSPFGQRQQFLLFYLLLPQQLTYSVYHSKANSRCLLCLGKVFTHSSLPHTAQVIFIHQSGLRAS